MTTYVPAIKKISAFSEPDGWDRNYMITYDNELACRAFAENWADKENADEFRAEVFLNE